MINIDELKICEFNIENLFVYMDMYQGEDLITMTEEDWKKLTYIQLQKKQKPLYKVFEVAKAILDIDADILMLCEVGGEESLSNFNKYFLNDLYDVYFVEGNSIRGIDLGYLIKKNLPLDFELKSNKNTKIEVDHYYQTVSSKFSRDVAQLNVYNPGEDYPCLVLLLAHLKSQISSDRDHKGRLTREAEVKGLAGIYEQLRRDLKVPVIVGGDFNADIREKEFAALEPLDLKDFHEVINTPTEDRTSHVFFDAAAIPHNNQIDYLCVSSDLNNYIDTKRSCSYRYKSFGIPNELPKNLKERYSQPSDHFPLVLVLKNLSNFR